MALPLYLAMTATEFQNHTPSPAHAAWMACHYSAYGLGLSNLPRTLPAGSLLILNDRTPPMGHDPALVLRQLTDLADTLDIGRVLLDFQRLDSPDNCAVAKALVTEAPCPVGVPAPYAKDLECPVFLPPVPPHIPLREHIVPWQGREIWLEAALGGEVITATATGSTFSPLSPADIPEAGLDDPALYCHYRTQTYDDHIDFTLWRTREDLTGLLREAERLGVTLAVGLWQELN